MFLTNHSEYEFDVGELKNGRLEMIILETTEL